MFWKTKGKMKIFKFKNKDNHYAFIFAFNQLEAEVALGKVTSIDFEFVAAKEQTKPIVLLNQMLPF